MSGHTPGPWSCAPTGDRKAYIIGAGQSAWGTHVAEVYADDTDHEEAVANARLIAATPEMLKALRVLISAIDHIRGDLGTQYPALSEAYVLGRDAIAKAEGR